MIKLVAMLILAPFAIPAVLCWVLIIPFVWAITVIDGGPAFGVRDALHPLYVFGLLK